MLISCDFNNIKLRSSWTHDVCDKQFNWSHIMHFFFTMFFLWSCGLKRAKASSFLRFLDHTQRRITVGRTSLDKWSARRRDLYLTTHNTHKASSFLRFLDHTQRHITVGRTPLDEWSARRRDLYLTTHNTQPRQTSMPPAVFEPTIPESERP